MLYRAEQECTIRQRELIGVQDGGLDQDFYVFTRLFYAKGYLKQPEFELCQRFYTWLCQVLPHPDVVILLSAPVDILVKRRSQRARRIDIAQHDDLSAIEGLIQDWMRQEPFANSSVSIDVSRDDPGFSNNLELISQIIEKSL
jgi:deoxyadenosine/deoxycytidine kinase